MFILQLFFFISQVINILFISLNMKYIIFSSFYVIASNHSFDHLNMIDYFSVIVVHILCIWWWLCIILLCKSMEVMNFYVWNWKPFLNAPSCLISEAKQSQAWLVCSWEKTFFFSERTYSYPKKEEWLINT